MTKAEINAEQSAIRLDGPDGTTTLYPFIWLRDNCPSGFHPDTQERTFDQLSVPLDIAPQHIAWDGNILEVAWAGSNHVSHFSADWLMRHKPGVRVADPAGVQPILWRGGEGAPDLPRAAASALLADDDALLEWLSAAKAVGLAIVEGMDDDPDAGMQVAARIGFLRETNFGRIFEVVSKQAPNNLAYTADGLPLHTDLTNQELPPGFQFLHCLANEAEGGGSLFCDGFAVAEDFRRDDPAAFDLLAQTVIPMRFHDEDYDIRRRDTVICLDHEGQLREIRCNAHLGGVFDMPASEMMAYYAAYRAYLTATRSDQYVHKLRLSAGEMVVFDNRRVLHGRDPFDPTTGKRHLRGCYVDRGEWDSRIRVLSRS